MIPDIVSDDEGWPIMMWFGTVPFSPACEELERKAQTPIGELCVECKQSILAYHEGYLIPLLTTIHPPVYQPWHQSCFAKTLVPRQDREQPPPT